MVNKVNFLELIGVNQVNVILFVSMLELSIFLKSCTDNMVTPFCQMLLHFVFSLFNNFSLERVEL